MPCLRLISFSNSNLTVVLIFQITLRWDSPLKRGNFHVVVHYFQPYHKSIAASAILNTIYNSVAGRLAFDFCPHVRGCRAVLLEEQFNSMQSIYISGNQARIILNLPANFKLWIVSFCFLLRFLNLFPSSCITLVNCS